MKAYSPSSMIISMSDLICITNRSLCKGDFLTQIEKIAMAHPKAIVLREKDLMPSEYSELAKQVMEVCEKHETPCILHSFTDIAKTLDSHAIHLPLPILRTLTNEDKQFFSVIGASCHSMEDAKEAEQLGCTYITAGHVFDTDCKKGLPGRGLDFLESVCKSVRIPVYAIGGIGKENYAAVKNAGASGACMMSGFMTCADAAEYIREIEDEVS